jgi:hypothetical protein
MREIAEAAGKTAVKQASQKSGIAKSVTKPDKMKKARAALKRATVKAKKADGNGAGAKKKRPGPPKGSGKVGQPWKALGISKAKFYRDSKAKTE